MVVQLTSLLEGPTALLLAYSVPLLLLSAVLTFSGTFLTLDRSRTFSPRSDATPSFPGGFEKETKVKNWTFRLDGGIGGLAIGYVFGLHASTFLSLLILKETSSAPLTSTTFLIVWLFSVIPFIVLGGRWRMVALTLLGICGGITLAVALCIITHPSLTSRVILTSAITPLTTLAVVLPSVLPSTSQSNLAHSTMRFASSCSGAFSMTMAVALLTRSSLSYSWANAWDRLWVLNGPGWGTSRERGFDTLFCVLWVSGSLCDWALKRWIGEDPDEKWDVYLADYSSTLPNAHDRAGNFVPLRSWWARWLVRLHLKPSSPACPREIIFPSDVGLMRKADYTTVPGAQADMKPSAHLSCEDLKRTVSPEAYNWDSPIIAKGTGILRKGNPRSEGGFRRVSDSDPLDAELKTNAFDLSRRPTFLQKTKSARTKQHWQRLAENRRRAPVKFQPEDGTSSESDGEDATDDDELTTPLGTHQNNAKVRVSPLVRMNSSATTLSGTTVHPSSSSGHGLGNIDTSDVLDIDSEKARLKNMKLAFGGVAGAARPVRSIPEYSDIEEDVTIDYARNAARPRDGTPGWKPEFLMRTSLGKPDSTTNERSAVQDNSAHPIGAVPKTPSLIYALGRLAKAQGDAYRPLMRKDDAPELGANQQSSPVAQRDHSMIEMDTRDHITGLPVAGDEQERASSDKGKWDSFWDEIQSKTGEA